ncbi:MAG: PQQ-binding-like beta-propeller repeat protein [Candidatus Rifleibacteriota bacterium]
MSKKLIGLIMVILGILAFHLLGSQPETTALWSASIEEKIYSDPVEVAGRFVLLGGNKGKRYYHLFEVDKNGKVAAKSVKLPVLPYQPIPFADKVVVVDKSNMVRGFSVPGLKLEWESGTMKPIALKPKKLDDKSFLISSGRHGLYCLNADTGKPEWDYQFPKTLVGFAADEVLICITGYTDVENPAWKISGHSVVNGQEMWALDEKVSGDEPVFVQGFCVTTTDEGQLLVIKQSSGQVVYRHPAKGLKVAQIIGDRVLLLAAGGSRIVCLSLMTGQSWTTTMNSSLTGAARYADKLILVNKKRMRCVDVSNGTLHWNRGLNDIYNAFPFKKGIFITHKDSFFDRSTYGSYFSVNSGTPEWTSYGRSIFRRPLVTEYGDLAVTYRGTIKMIPTSEKTDLITEESQSINEKTDPEQKIIFFEQEKEELENENTEESTTEASATKPVTTDGDSSVNTEKKSKKDSDDPIETDLKVKDTGWLSD